MRIDGMIVPLSITYLISANDRKNKLGYGQETCPHPNIFLKKLVIYTYCSLAFTNWL